MRLSTMLASGLIGVGILAFSALSASAAIVCSGNVCWHVQERYSYPPSAGVVIHEARIAPPNIGMASCLKPGC